MLNYHLTTDIWLSLEPYYNQGVTPEEAKEIIEKIHDTTLVNLSCRSAACNGNWIVRTSAKKSETIQAIVDEIDWRLHQHLEKKKRKERGDSPAIIRAYGYEWSCPLNFWDRD